MSKLRERVEEQKRQREYQANLAKQAQEEMLPPKIEPEAAKVQPTPTAIISQKDPLERVVDGDNAEQVIAETVPTVTTMTDDMLEQVKRREAMFTARGLQGVANGVLPSTDASKYDDLVSFEEACRQLNINWSWLKLWTMTKLIQPVRSPDRGNRFMISCKQLNALLDASPCFGPKRVVLRELKND